MGIREMFMEMKAGIKLEFNYSEFKWECITDYPYMGIGVTSEESIENMLEENSRAIESDYMEMFEEMREDQGRGIWD